MSSETDSFRERKPQFATDSGITIDPWYRPTDVQTEGLGLPGEFPYTRGIQPTMYRGRLWTMRQYAGFGSATETNDRFKYLLANGQTGLSVAFDLPTQMGTGLRYPLPEAKSAKWAWPSTHCTTWKSCSKAFRWIAFPRR